MSHQTTIQFFRGPFSSLPTLAEGEPGFCTDTYQFFIGDGATNHEIGAGGGAPTNADYLVKTSSGSLSAERVVTDTASIVANWATAGQVKFNVQFGGGAGTACDDDDPRLSDSRTPTAHASSHQHGGSDEIATATAGANAIPKAGAGGTLAIGWIPTGATSSTVCIGNDSRLSDARTPTGSAGGDLSGTYPNPAVAKLQGYAVYNIAPTDGYVLTWDNANSRWAPAAATGGLPSGAAGGDLTGSYPNPTIGANKVTYAKMQASAAAKRVIGRDSGTAGDYGEVSISSLLDWVGTPGQGDILYRGATTWGVLNAGVSGKFLQSQGAGADPVWADPAGVSDGDKGDVTVSSSGTVWTIDNGVVTYAKMQNMSASKILGRMSTTGDPQEISTEEALDFLSTTQGSVLYRGASAWVALGPGTAGQALFTNGASANPAWATIPTATRSDMESASSTTVFVTPGRAIYHPGVAKATLFCTTNAGGSGTASSVTTQNSYGISSVTRNAKGDYSITLSTAFSTAYYVGVGVTQDTGSDLDFMVIDAAHNPTTTVYRIRFPRATGGYRDPDMFSLVFFGDQ